MASGLFGSIMSRGRTLADVMFSSNKRKIYSFAAIGLGSIGAINMIRGISIGHKRRISRDELEMMQRNPVLAAYDERQGHHMSGAAQYQRDMRLFRR